MADEKTHKEKENVVVVELKVSMHCKACERTVNKILTKFKGVDTVLTDMAKHRAVVTGRVEAEKLRKKLRKKTGKKVEIVAKKGDEKKETGDGAGGDEADKQLIGCQAVKDEDGLLGGLLLDIFSDENPNACVIM